MSNCMEQQIYWRSEWGLSRFMLQFHMNDIMLLQMLYWNKTGKLMQRKHYICIGFFRMYENCINKHCKSEMDGKDCL